MIILAINIVLVTWNYKSVAAVTVAVAVEWYAAAECLHIAAA